MSDKKGFTLIEIMVAIGIVGILASVALASMSSYKDNAQAAKISASFSSVIPSMATCWSFGGSVNAPSNNEPICSLSSSYGRWPEISDNNYQYGSSSAMCAYHQGSPNPGPFCTLSKNSWYFGTDGTNGHKKICCNSTIKGCKAIDYSADCDLSVN